MSPPYTPPWSVVLLAPYAQAWGLVHYHSSFADWSVARLGSVFMVVAVLLRMLYTTVVWPKALSPLRHLPQAPGATFFNGHFSEILKRETGMPMRDWINTVPNDGILRYTFLLNEERVMATNPKALSEVMVTRVYDYAKPSLARSSLGRLLGVGVLLAEGEEHKFQRKNLMPAFHYRHIKDLVPTFWSLSTKMVGAVTKEVNQKIAAAPETKDEGAVVEFHTWLNRATLDIIGLAGMGFEFGAIDDPENELNQTYRRVFAPSGQAKLMGLMSVFLPWWLLQILPVQRNFDVAIAAEKIRDTSRKLIERKQQEMKEKGDVHKDILSVALESGAFTVDNLVDQTMTFLAAGHETTATATQWAMVELARHPGIQSRLREEIRANLPAPDEDGLVTNESLDKLPYLQAFCQEVLRFRAPVPFTRREAVVDTIILGQRIPKGTHVVLVPYAVNFSKELWGDDADEFNPERWMAPGRANTGGAESAYSNMTFIHGPRACIGAQFAKHEFQCLVAAIIGRFEVDLEPKDREIKLESGIVTRPKGGLPLRMKVIEGW